MGALPVLAGNRPRHPAQNKRPHSRVYPHAAQRHGQTRSAKKRAARFLVAAHQPRTPIGVPSARRYAFHCRLPLPLRKVNGPATPTAQQLFPALYPDFPTALRDTLRLVVLEIRIGVISVATRKTRHFAEPSCVGVEIQIGEPQQEDNIE